MARGLLAGAVGTAVMDLVMFNRYRRSGGESGLWAWESSAGLERWEDAPAPAQVGRRVAEGFLQRELPAHLARLTNNLTHWSYGLVWGAQYGIVASSLRRRRLGQGLVFGAAVWSSGYVVLPLAKLYKPIWDYDAKTLGKDLSAHLAYGLATEAAFRLLGGA